jgi:hypothetical protein
VTNRQTTSQSNARSRCRRDRVLERSFNTMASSLEQSHEELAASRVRIVAAGDQARRGSNVTCTTAPIRVEALGGTIQVHSPAGQGARLLIDLPIQDRPSS